MWILFNPTDVNVSYPVNYQGKLGNWKISPGETKKFPNEVGEALSNNLGFLEVLQKDGGAPKKKIVYKPPTNLDDIEEADPEMVDFESRAIRHPSSDPSIQESGGFGSGRAVESNESDDNDTRSGLKLKKMMREGKMVQIDKHGVEWYGKGIQKDLNPFKKE